MRRPPRSTDPATTATSCSTRLLAGAPRRGLALLDRARAPEAAGSRPQPWTTPEVALDLRPGGASRFVMRSPEGEDFPNAGVYLEVVPERRLVFTDAYTEALGALGEALLHRRHRPRRRGRRHPLHRDRPPLDRRGPRRAREDGLPRGWGQCADQLEALARTL